jgi:ATP/ADP translocase
LSGLWGGAFIPNPEEGLIMAKRLILAMVAVLFAAGLSVARQDNAKPGSWSGVITNNMCGPKDATAAKAECTTKCVKSHGAKYALYDEADKKVYILDPQDKAEGHAGHDVTVTGTLDGDTIHVSSLTMNTAKGS